MTSTEPVLAADTTSSTQHLVPLLQRLTLEEKAAFIQGADFWSTIPLPSIGLRAMVLSDGPAGVRGPKWDERDPSLSLPSGTALAASWDLDIARQYGVVAAAEARRKGVDVVLGPTINLHRSPLGGRHFECFSEDPFLTAELGAAYIAGLQDNGVAATPKHYVANDSETERFTVDVRPTSRALRELYLAPFERAVEAGAWAVMSSYNAVDGVTMSESPLLSDPLNTEWGFDGVVISDWTAVRSEGSIPAAQDLAMPGPAPAWAEVVEGVRAGRLDEADIDRKVLRLLLLAERVGAFEESPAVIPEIVDGRLFARDAAVEGLVLLRNQDGELPWNAATLSRVAVIGHNAAELRTQGGGSATVIPDRVVSPLSAIRDALPTTQVDYAIGAVVQEGIAGLPLDWMTNPATGQPGLVATFRDQDGNIVDQQHRRSTALVWFDGDAPLETAATLELHTILTADRTGTVQLGFATGLHGRLIVNGDTLIDQQPRHTDPTLGASFSFPPAATATVLLRAGVPVDTTAVFDLRSASGPMPNALGLTFGMGPDATDPDTLIRDAVAVARDADVVVVVVGTNAKVESEGRDRTSLALPGRQDDLVRAVAAANPRTVVIVNSGAPVLMPWRNDVSAVLLSWFGGQEAGRAISDVLVGVAEPGGRLPTTWPANEADVPVIDVTPTDGRLIYDEGIHIGYRAWMKADTPPAFPFGHGLGYTTWSFDAVDATVDSNGTVHARVRITNTGVREGKQVVQLYAERTDSTVERPTRWLVGFAAVRALAHEPVTVELALPGRVFAHWEDGWRIEPGKFTLRAGVSIENLPLTTTIDIENGDGPDPLLDRTRRV